jgi:hypothetical protein
MLKSWTLPCLCLGLFALAMYASRIHAAPTTEPSALTPVSDAEKLQFQQKNASAQMQELQERMFKLADLVKKTEPDDSAKLLMGVRKAREELIVEEMNAVFDTLGQKDFGRATGQEQEVLVKLETLRQLLLTNDMDLQLQLEQLKKLREAIAQVDKAIAAQKKLNTDTNTAKPTELANLQQNQSANQKATDNVTQAAKNLAPVTDAAVPPLAAASQAMGGAAGKIGEGKPSDASIPQQQALDNLQKARDELEAQRQLLLAKIEPSIRKQVIENLTQMLETQKSIRESTEALAPRIERNEREATLALRRLSPVEGKIVTLADQTIALVEETEFSFALPPALKSVERRMVLVAADLESSRADATVVKTETQIERDLADLIDTFKTAPPTPNNKVSRCKGCKGNKNTILAELKAIRLLQVRVNEETEDVDQQRKVELAKLDKSLRDKVGEVRDDQTMVRDTLDQLDAAVFGKTKPEPTDVSKRPDVP